MRVFLIVGALVAAANASKFAQLVLQEWETHKSTYNLKFPTTRDDQYRLDIYISNRVKIAEHNAEFARGDVGFTMGENQFTHMMNEEVNDIMNGFNRTARKGGKVEPETTTVIPTFILPEGDVPDEIDWRKKGAVTPVKDQGNCGSCYAFSAVGALEGQHFRKTGKLVSLSEQNIVDCSHQDAGCDGGSTINALQYVNCNKGIDTENGYPYKGKVQTCKYSAKSKGASDSGVVITSAGDENDLKKAVALLGPISVAIDSSHDSFTKYRKGIYYEPKCGSTLDHAVLVVGYGTENGKDYWLVKNSWGTAWGDLGYIKMARNRNNNCGIAVIPSFPLM